jgi:plastocyanin
MNAKSALTFACVTACTLLAALALPVRAAELSVTVSAADGTPLEGAVVLAEPAAAAARARAAPGAKAIMDQRNLMFVPDVLIVQAGTAVDFPNSDQVRHQVYSFSGAKNFQLALYAGKAPAPVLFDKTGLVTLGCNIHDSMLGYIIVTDSPWYGRTGNDGTLRLRELAPGEYRLTLWHPLIDETGPQLQQQLNVTEGAAPRASFRLTRALRPPLHHHGADKKWDDY